ncbi:CBS domain-containing protein [Pseudonocardia endophytica]|uniref:CBS domain protein n=1 Tax=Pseudonocardia endophytica TaxID=401976 RepID=A0A4R1HKW9_PSEEN|nr:CBS domain-containing protein [Pseudonocardia endophytica]TCK21633.1 CBS domain protein [Pseudonocardia endophytica]
MKVADILRIKGDDVTTVPSWTSMAEAVQLLSGPPAIGALVVSDDGRGRLDGIVSERDVVRRLAADGPSLLERTVGDVMVHLPESCTPEDTLAEVMATMTRSRHRHLPVVVGGRIRGLISIGDVVRQRLAEMTTETGVLRDIYLASR